MSTGTESHTSVKTAMSDVLRAEREALVQMAECDSRAEQILGDARQTVRAMVRRTQQRISRLHASCAQKTRELIDLMQKDAADYASCAVPADREKRLLQNVVSTVARQLTTMEQGRGD